MSSRLDRVNKKLDALHVNSVESEKELYLAFGLIPSDKLINLLHMIQKILRDKGKDE